MKTPHRIIGIFPTYQSARDAVEHLSHAGFSIDSISVLLADRPEAREYLMGPHGKPAETAVIGSATGGVLAAIVATALALPGVGVLAAGPVVAALGGAGVGAVGGGALGALVGLGIPENEAAVRTEELERGSVIVGVETNQDARADVARGILATGGTLATQ